MEATKLYSLVLTKSGKETVYMTGDIKKVKARKKILEISLRGKKTNFHIRLANEDEEKYRKPPSFNFDPSGDTGSKKHIQRKSKAKRIKQKNPTKQRGRNSGKSDEGSQSN